ncbi:Uncharacterized protein dnm_074470 [Desulfonema magnum]|uniref:Uncharacterized protein n=1 Tax=Desulfonema magnum TaxID=45655 RepID=A0A975BTR7_9BACT|nr:Uncharacterized protein dnm_074470 [Desulfonema magnum]
MPDTEERTYHLLNQYPVFPGRFHASGIRHPAMDAYSRF